jgi:hypothetical protein
MTTAQRRGLLLGLGAAILLPRAYLAVVDQGMVWSDEIFQILEQGHRLAFGYGLVPWEFKVGARSWLLPGVIGSLMKLLAALGVGSGAGLAMALKLLFAGLAVATCYPMLRAAYALGGRFALLLFGLLSAVLPASLVYGSRVLAEAASAPFLAWGLWLLLPWGMAGRLPPPRCERIAWRGVRGEPITQLVLAGALLGLGTLLRYQNAILLPVVVLLVAARRGLRPCLWVLAGMALVLLAGGLLDWAMWGRPFHSVLVYLRFNLVESGASQWGIAKRGFYLRTLLATNGPAVLLVVLGFFAGLRRTWPLALLVLLYVVVLSSIPHKELRFVVPVLPLFLACGAVGLAGLLRKLPFPASRQRAAALGLGLGMVLLLAVRARGVTFRDIGQAMPPPDQGGPTSSLVWGAFGERNRLFDLAGRHEDLCGLAAPAMNPYWTGGYTYLHRRVPLLWSAWEPDLAAANYLMVGPGLAFGDPRYKSVAQVGPYLLLRREGACQRPLRSSLGYGRLTAMGVPGA